MQTTLTLTTHGPGLYEFTPQVIAWLEEENPATNGLLTVFIRHTSASLLIQENADPSVQADLMGFLRRLVPPGDAPSMDWLTHVFEGPDDMPAHIKAALLPVSLSIPISRGKLALGTWQGIYVFEHRSRPHARQIVLHASR